MNNTFWKSIEKRTVLNIWRPTTLFSTIFVVRKRKSKREAKNKLEKAGKKHAEARKKKRIQQNHSQLIKREASRRQWDLQLSPPTTYTDRNWGRRAGMPCTPPPPY